MRSGYLLALIAAVTLAFAGCERDACNDECDANSVCDETLLACVPIGGLDGGTTTQCTSNADCKDATRPKCDSSGLCVGCTLNTDCPGGRCDPLTLTCAQAGCNRASDCKSPSAPFCGADGNCVECLVSSDCGPKDNVRRTCDPLTNRCVPNPCRQDDDCAVDPGGRACEPGSGACVACVRDEQCPTPATGVARCRPSTHSCVGCLSDSDCDASLGQVCDDATGACKSTGCVSDAMCAPQRCNGATRQCVSCLTSADCAFGGACSGGVCIEPASCAADADCIYPSRCASGTCAECLSDADCRSGQACSPLGRCVEPTACNDATSCLSGRTCTNGACAAAACTADALEPNDTAGVARAIPTGRVDAVLCPNERDFYVLPVRSGDGVSVEISYDPTQGSPRLSLMPGTPARSAVAAADDGSGRQVVTIENLPANTAQVLVRVDGGDGSHRLAYSLESKVAAGLCADDGREPDDSQNQAQRASPGVYTGTLCPANTDWLALDVAAGDRALATLSLVGAPTGSASVELYTLSSGGALRREAFGFASVSQPAPMPAAGKVWVVVRNQAGGKLNYSLAVDVRTAPPANDTCAQASVLSPNVSTTGTTKAATRDQLSACGGDGGDVHYALTLAQPSSVQLSVSAEFAATVSLSRTCAGAELGCATRGADATSLSFEALPAGNYLVRVAAPAGGEGAFSLSASVQPASPAPGNESCATAALLAFSNGSASVSGSTALAADELVSGCGATGGDVAYLLSLAQDQRVVATLRGVTGASVALVSAASCGVDAPAACVPMPAGTAPAVLDRPLVTAGDWILIVDGGTARAGLFQLDVRLESPLYPPANDQCTGAIALAPTQSADTRGAQDDFAPVCGAAGGHAPDAVYRLDVTEDSRLDLSLDATFDAALAVTTGDCATGTPVACADGRRAALSLPALAPGTYWIWVDGWRSESGTFTLTSTTTAAPPVPANDTCGAAELVELSQGAVTRGGQTLRALDDVHPAQCADASGVLLTLDGPDVTYAVDVPSGKTLVAQLTPVAYDAALYVIDACAATTCLAAADQSFLAGGAESLEWANGGASARRVIVVVDSWRAGAAGDFSLGLSLR